MPVNQLHRDIAAVALRAAARHGFALAGGNALLAHEFVIRETEDVDLFTNVESGVEAAADAVESALRKAGFETVRQDKTAGLADVFEGMGEGLAEWIVTAPDGRQTMLQLSYFDREHEPVRMDLGPVLDLEDLIGQKVCALASRIEVGHAKQDKPLLSASREALSDLPLHCRPIVSARDAKWNAVVRRDCVED